MMIAFFVLLALVVLAADGMVVFWEWKRKRNADKTYVYHLRVTLISGKILRLDLDDQFYKEFMDLLNNEQGKFSITKINPADGKTHDLSTVLFIKHIAAVEMSRW